MNIDIKVNDLITVYQPTGNGSTFTLLHGFVKTIFDEEMLEDEADHFFSAKNTVDGSSWNQNWTLNHFFANEEGVRWVRGHVTARHKLGRAMIAAARLLR